VFTSQQACSKLVNTLKQCYFIKLLQDCYSQLVELQDDNQLLEQLVTSLLSSTTCQGPVDNFSTNWEQAVRTHPVDKSLEQHCYKSAAGLLQLVRFYVCTVGELAFLSPSSPR
jgi:hypothetical protein